IPQGTYESGIYDFTDLENNYINKNGYIRFFNNEAKVPILYNNSNQTFISYDDQESIDNKTGYLKAHGLAGAMVWDISGDRNKTLLSRLASDLSEVITPTPNTDSTPPSTSITTPTADTTVSGITPIEATA